MQIQPDDSPIIEKFITFDIPKDKKKKKKSKSPKKILRQEVKISQTKSMGNKKHQKQ